jgi:hypothetical protein
MRPVGGVALVLGAVLALTVGGCREFASIIGQPQVICGDYEGPDCNDLLEIGGDALQAGHVGAPTVIAVGDVCPPSARCLPSSLGGAVVAVVESWPDGTITWASIPLPADWPASPPGAATVETDPVPDHLVFLVGNAPTPS